MCLDNQNWATSILNRFFSIHDLFGGVERENVHKEFSRSVDVHKRQTS